MLMCSLAPLSLHILAQISFPYEPFQYSQLYIKTGNVMRGEGRWFPQSKTTPLYTHCLPLQIEKVKRLRFLESWVIPEDSSELKELCAKLWNSMIQIHGETICQSWSLLTPFYS